jgi:hypothetical protein
MTVAINLPAILLERIEQIGMRSAREREDTPNAIAPERLADYHSAR